MLIRVFFVILHIVFVSGLPCKDIMMFVDGHNIIRLMILQGLLDGQPQAENMFYMMWDEELDRAAQYTAMNNFIPSAERPLQSDRYIIGENVYEYSRLSDQSCDGQEALDYWVDGYEYYEYKKMEKRDWMNPKYTWRYTQMIWMDSIYLGCAISKHKKEMGYYCYVVCHYGPPGNIVGQYPYKNGTARSENLSCGVDDCSRLYGENCSLEQAYYD